MGRMWPDPKPAGGPLPKGSHGRKPPASGHHASGKSSSSAYTPIAVAAVLIFGLPFAGGLGVIVAVILRRFT